MRSILAAAILLFALPLFGQDATGFEWNVVSKKTDDKKYELIFTTPGLSGWDLYAPNQDFDGFKTIELKFLDSTIRIAQQYADSGSSKVLKSPIFETDVRLLSGTSTIKSEIIFDSIVPANLMGELTYSYGKDDNFYTLTHSFTIALEGGTESGTRTKIASIDIKNPVVDCGDDDSEGKSLFGIFLLGLAGGFIALLTPCVFPMIPLTVSFFTKKGQGRGKGAANAALYGFFIFLIYVLLSIPFHLFNASPQVLNNISTNVWLNLFFFVIFVVFAISFFGYFEITLPGGIANKASSKSGIGSVGGIFFMAFTLAIVSFSCTGPILGSLLVGTLSENGGPMQLTAGMAGFGLALALPFALFAVFPNLLQSIPKSGGWLNSVKVVLGFLELAMAVKFLSNADLVEQWGLLKRELFLAIWILIGMLTILYLFGKIRFPHDAPLKKITKGRTFFIVVFTIGTLYLLPGVTNTKYANLKIISGFPPPLCYSLYTHPENCKEGFEPLRDYEIALKEAREKNKPLLIDFTGWACVNCRRMEEAVWTDPVVDSLMRNEFVVVSLYVDERTKLPLNERTTYVDKTGKEQSIITIGDKWSAFQIENFYATSQPQYAILSPQEKALTKTKFYTPDADEFAEWLKCGLNAFNSKKP